MSAGANVSQKDSFGRSPLHEGVLSGREFVCKALLEAGVCPGRPKPCFKALPPRRLPLGLV